MTKSTISTTAQPQGFVANLLFSSNIKNAALIDDVYNDIEDKEIEIEEIRKFHEENEDDSILENLLIELNISKPDDEGLENIEVQTEYLNSLWNARTMSPELRKRIELLFSTRFSKEKDLIKISENLQKLGLSVKTFPADVDANELMTEDRTFDLIFIDYFLGVDNSKDAIAAAERKIREIHQKYDTGKKPVTILMSSSPDAAKHKEQFRKNAKILEGVFRFSPKSDLKDEQVMSLVIGALAKEFIKGHDIQDYVSALCAAAQVAMEKFQQEVRSLNVEDYVFVQNIGLESDDQPLGDYLSWLFGSYWTQLLIGNKLLAKERKKMNDIFKTAFPILHGSPSMKIADIYMDALFEHVGDVAFKPKKRQEVKDSMEKESEENNEIELQARLNSSVQLNLGDLFVKSEDHPVWMIINAQCDLEHTTAHSFSILMIPGNMVPWGLPLVRDESSIWTEFFRFSDKSYRINWDPQLVKSMPLGHFISWKTEEKYKRIFKLKEVFALDIQRSFSARLTRIGLPIAPPITGKLKLAVYYKKPDDSIGTLLTSSNVYAARVPIKNKNNIENKIVFTLKFGQDLVIKVRELGTEFNLGSMREEDLKKMPIATLITNFDKWFFGLATKAHKIPESGKEPVDMSTRVYMASDWSKNGSNADWKKAAIIIDIMNDEE